MTTASSKVSVDCAIVCDDVRREQNGKLILIGVYGNNIIVPSYPVTLKLSIVLAGHSDVSAQVPLKLRILQDANNYWEADGQMVFDVAGAGLFPVGGLEFSVAKNTDIDIQTRVGRGRFKSIRKIQIQEKSP